MSLYLNLDEDELVRQPFLATPLPSSRVVYMCGRTLQKTQPIVRMFSYAFVKFVNTEWVTRNRTGPELLGTKTVRERFRTGPNRKTVKPPEKNCLNRT